MPLLILENNANRKKTILPNESFFQQLKVFLDQGREVAIPVKGRSMLPFLRSGDKVLIEPLRTDLIRKGSIVLSETAYGVVLHRIVRIKGSSIWLAGDANLVQEEEVCQQDIMGVVKAVCRENQWNNVTHLQMPLVTHLWNIARPIRKFLYALYKFGTKRKNSSDITN